MKPAAILRVSSAAAVIALLTPGAFAAAIVFDDFNTNEGHFTNDPNFSGSSLNDAATSIADLLTGDNPLEGLGHQRLVLDWEDNADAGTNLQIRHLSGGGTIANNTAFTTSSAGVDGWIGFYLKTLTPGWTAQIWIEGPENNGGVPKSIIADGTWHLYEWNLDDETGGPDGWGPIPTIIAGDADVQEGSYTIDSIIFRDGTTASTTIDLDFVAKSDSGSVAGLIPEPSSAVLLMGSLGLLALRRRR